MGESEASKATSEYFVIGTPNWSAMAWRSMPFPAEHWFESLKSLISPFWRKRTLMSWPPISQTTSASGKKLRADIMWATVSTMFTSARTDFSRTGAA